MENINFITLPNDVNINLLSSQYSEHCQEALDQAMTTLQAVEMPIQNFNTLGCVTKDTYYKIMCHYKRRLHDDPSNKKTYYIALICLIDTLTCMIKESAFFEEYKTNIKHLLIITTACLQIMSPYCNTKDLNAEQVGILLSLIKKFFERIKNHEQMDMSIIFNMKLIIENIQLAHDIKIDRMREECPKNERNNNNVNISVNGANEGLLKEFSSKKNIKNNKIFCDISQKKHMENKQKKTKDENIKLPTLRDNKDTTKKVEKVNAFAYMMARSKTVFKKK